VLASAAVVERAVGRADRYNPWLRSRHARLAPFIVFNLNLYR